MSTNISPEAAANVDRADRAYEHEHIMQATETIALTCLDEDDDTDVTVFYGPTEPFEDHDQAAGDCDVCNRPVFITRDDHDEAYLERNCGNTVVIACSDCNEAIMRHVSEKLTTRQIELLDNMFETLDTIDDDLEDAFPPLVHGELMAMTAADQLVIIRQAAVALQRLASRARADAWDGY